MHAKNCQCCSPFLCKRRPKFDVPDRTAHRFGLCVFECAESVICSGAREMPEPENVFETRVAYMIARQMDQQVYSGFAACGNGAVGGLGAAAITGRGGVGALRGGTAKENEPVVACQTQYKYLWWMGRRMRVYCQGKTGKRASAHTGLQHLCGRETLCEVHCTERRASGHPHTESHRQVQPHTESSSICTCNRKRILGTRIKCESGRLQERRLRMGLYMRTHTL